jgi:hypothetical protein
MDKLTKEQVAELLAEAGWSAPIISPLAKGLVTARQTEEGSEILIYDKDGGVLEKAHIKGHYRTVNGKQVWIEAHDDKRGSTKLASSNATKDKADGYEHTGVLGILSGTGRQRSRSKREIELTEALAARSTDESHQALLAALDAAPLGPGRHKVMRDWTDEGVAMANELDALRHTPKPAAPGVRRSKPWKASPKD